MSRMCFQRQQYTRTMFSISILLTMIAMMSVVAAAYPQTQQNHSRFNSSTNDIHTGNIRNKRDSELFSGHVCFGTLQGAVQMCDIRINFTQESVIKLEITIGPTDRFSWTKGSYTQGDKTGSWEYNIEQNAYIMIVVYGEEPVNWSGDLFVNKPQTSVTTEGKFGRVLYTYQLWVIHLEPQFILKTQSLEIPWIWTIEASRQLVSVQVAMHFMVTDYIISDIMIQPGDIEIHEGRDELRLACNTHLVLPPESIVTWTRDGGFVGSMKHSSPRIIHRGVVGKVDWIGQMFVYHLHNPTFGDSGNYTCCVTLTNHQQRCGGVRVNVISSKMECQDKEFKVSSPFQMNHFQSKSLLLDGRFATIVWNFNVSQWKISSRFPQCKDHLVNMENGLEQWFGENPSASNRQRRDILGSLLGGFGSMGSVLNSMDIQTLNTDLKTVGLIGERGLKIQRGLNQILKNMVMNTASVIAPSVQHLQEAVLALMNSAESSQIARACLEIQFEYSTDFKVMAQALQGGVTPLKLQDSLPEEFFYAKNHSELWVNKWLGCRNNMCISTSLIPISGMEKTLFSMAVLGIPVSTTQLLFYKLQYPDFVFYNNLVEPEQVDLADCLHFSSKIICLHHQVKTIYHSCFHNQSSCVGRIETVKTPHDLVTPVEKDKVCVQVMSDNELVKAMFPRCTHSRMLLKGLYCIDGGPLAIYIHGTQINISKSPSQEVDVIPVQFNVTQTNDFPWKKWANEIRKDAMLLQTLQKHLKEAEVVFQHEQGKLKDIEHEWSVVSSSSWWSNFIKSTTTISKTSIGSAVVNIVVNPFIIVFFISIVCIIVQIVMLCRIRHMYKEIKIELKQRELLTQHSVRRVLYPSPTESRTQKSCD